ncbi:xylosyltransferase oxt-like [Pollicipes pollicipes]|uniref:xylosyltransferase oxt-like n=1 Tax=Pollicipes pollicipes TaxID=41117 RepID=UPI0018856517|nr:xylosyltransferase oxt-like [Pollicipes pollicipes]
MAVTTTCYDDTKYRNAKVVHLKYRSLLESGVRNYSRVQLMEREVLSEHVFGLTCPQHEAVRAAGYRGRCEPGLFDPRTLRDRAAFVMSKVHSEQCRQRMSQVLCALEYSRSAECLPPFMWNGDAGDGGLSFLITPTVGSRPVWQPPAATRHPSLEPVTIGFYLLVHSGFDAVMELLERVYDPAHLYVIHVDLRSTALRRELEAALAERYPDRQRLRLLEKHRSFAASWGSERILRAELECLEELLRMAPWDFAVPLSGLDLPLRPAAELAATLAPYRGRNLLHHAEHKFMRTHEENNVFAMFGCGDFVFNVSRPGNRPLRLKIPVYGHATWKALDRQFVEFVISELPSSPLARWSLLLRVIIIPDEHFFATVLMNSRYSDTLLRAKVHHPKRFQGENRMVCADTGTWWSSVARAPPLLRRGILTTCGSSLAVSSSPGSSRPTSAIQPGRSIAPHLPGPYYESIQHVFPTLAADTRAWYRS